jgi:glycosyltransferase involved in cell wall biosynthesis
MHGPLMKVIITGFFGFPNGMGATARALAYAQGLTRCRAEVQVICVKPSESATGGALNPEVSGVYRGIPFLYTSGSTRVAKTRLGAAWLYFKGLIGLIQAVGRASRNDEKCTLLVFTDDSPSLLIVSWCAARLHGAKFVAEATEFPLIYRKPTARNRLIVWFNNRFAYPRLDGLIVISTYLEGYFRKMLGPRARILRIPIMVESDLWAREQLVQATQSFTIAYCGNLDHLGEVDDLIRAFLNVRQDKKPLRLLLIGGGSRLSALQHQAASLNSEGAIEFTGLLPRLKGLESLSSADLLILPRKSDTFSSAGFPTKLGEYLATGKPVIVSATGDIPLYLKDGENAYLVQPGDVKALTNRLQEAVTHYERALQVGQAGRRVAVEHFDVGVNCGRVISFLTELWEGV